MNSNSDFTTRLYLERVHKRLTQEELANKIGISRHSLRKLETGETAPSFSTLKALTEVFNCSADYLIGNTDSREPIAQLSKQNPITVQLKTIIEKIDSEPISPEPRREITTLLNIANRLLYEQGFSKE